MVEERTASGPGRICPLRYRHARGALRAAHEVQAETLYVVGGLYGNVDALREILAMKDAEERAGRRVTLVFNGDFNWFDVDDGDFREVNESVLEHRATLGNVEAELDGDGDVGCGCAYPSYVAQSTVDRSNAIMERLRGCARRHADVRARLAGLPMLLAARVAGVRVGVVHGDPESLAGWKLAVENLAPPDARLRAELGLGEREALTGEAEVERFLADAGVRVLACTHTCLPYMQDYVVDGEACVVVNNGSAGMANFRGDRRGVITRISADPAPPAGALYGWRARDARVDALPVAFDHAAWMKRFLSSWPRGSAAHRSYHERIVDGPRYRREQAMRLRGGPSAGDQPDNLSTRSTISPASPV